MKFTIIALVGALASANASQLRSKARHLEGNNNNRAAIDYTAVISFAKCIEVSVQPEDADENTQAAITAGTAKPLQSYAAFYTNTYANSNEMMMTNLGDYVAAKVQASSAMMNLNFCQACREFQDTCNTNTDDAAQQEAADGEEAEEAADGEERNLAATAIDCSACQASNCYVENNGQVDYAELVGQFVEEAAECMQVQNYQDANGNAAYIGLSCGSYGDAAEFAVFLDEDCTIETNQLTVSTVLASAGANDQGVSYSTLLSATSPYLQEAFTTSMSCEALVYYDPNNADNNNNNEANQMSEACQEITNEAVFIADCQLEEGDEEQAQDEDKWYEFDVDEAGNIDQACGVVNYKLNKGESFKYFYDEKTQGSNYARDKSGHLTSTTASASAGMSGGVIFLIVALVIVIVVAPVAWLIKTKRNTQASESDYQGGTLS